MNTLAPSRYREDVRLLGLCLSSLLLAAPVGAAPTWVEQVRQATADDAAARACAIPQIIRYHSTRALLARAERDPERFTQTAIASWRLRLLELKRAATSCLVPNAPKEAELVVEVDLPPETLAEDWFVETFDDEGEEGAGTDARYLLFPQSRPDARPPMINSN